jgi:ribonuclease HII
VARTTWRHPAYTPRRDAGLSAYERVLARAGLSPVVGIDEAGRGACAGPLVVAAVSLDLAAVSRLPGLADSKALTPAAREEMYTEIVVRALDWHVVVIPSREIDQLGLHVCNVGGMRRALAGLRCGAGYVLTDGFPVRGLGIPALAMWKGDQVAACVAAASIVAKVSRDRIMTDLHESYPDYGFASHKGYSTPDHMKALAEVGPCREHRFSYANVIGLPGDRADDAAQDLDGDAARDLDGDAAQGGDGDAGEESAAGQLTAAPPYDLADAGIPAEAY